jgi:hypothetical protein
MILPKPINFLKIKQVNSFHPSFHEPSPIVLRWLFDRSSIIGIEAIPKADRSGTEATAMGFKARCKPIRTELSLSFCN